MRFVRVQMFLQFIFSVETFATGFAFESFFGHVNRFYVSFEFVLPGECLRTFLAFVVADVRVGCDLVALQSFPSAERLLTKFTVDARLQISTAATSGHFGGALFQLANVSFLKRTDRERRRTDCVTDMLDVVAVARVFAESVNQVFLLGGEVMVVSEGAGDDDDVIAVVPASMMRSVVRSVRWSMVRRV